MDEIEEDDQYLSVETHLGTWKQEKSVIQSFDVQKEELKWK
jgi:hypothetical protein